MKKTIFILSMGILFFSQVCNAQSYKTNKQHYQTTNYSAMSGDKYNPDWCGFASFFIPGLGQMIAGETGRGLAFLGGQTLSVLTFAYGAMVQFQDSFTFPPESKTKHKNRGSYIALAGLSSMLSVSIWSCIDANKVAKINNLYLRDSKKKNSIRLNVSPYLDSLVYQNTGNLPVGLSLSLRF